MRKFDVVVIGSGCGGAPVGGSLAEAGADVCVLERGTWWGEARGHMPFPAGYLELLKSVRGVGISLPFFKKYLSFNDFGLLEFYFVNGYTIIIPSGVGGGSLVIGGFIDKPPSDVFESYPLEITEEAMGPYFESVEKVVSPAIAPKETWYQEIIDYACERIPHINSIPQKTSMWYGDDPDVERSRVNEFGCLQNSCSYRADCLTGCNTGAKNSMDVTFLQSVLSGGGEIRDLCEAECIRAVSGGYTVEYRDLREGAAREITAPRVVVSAGALNTMRILFASRRRVDGLPWISRRLGDRWGFNGDRIGLRLSRERLGHRYGSCLFRYMEADSPERDFEYHYFACRSSFFAWPPPPLDRLTDRVMAFLSLSREEPIGVIKPSGDVVDIFYPSQECHRVAAIDQKRVAYEVNQLSRPSTASSRRRRLRRIEQTRRWRGLGSVHPTGGAAMADTEAEGVVDHRGEVFNYPNLYVSDASLFPVSSCAGPHFFIMANACRIADMVIQSEK